MKIKSRTTRSALQHNFQNLKVSAAKPAPILLGIGVLLAAMAAAVKYNTKKAERDNPPEGKFIDVDGARLHYLEKGTGDPLVLIHGNGTLAADYQISTVFDQAARDHRVIAFDRPGYGYSDRPSKTVWTASAQAALLHKALQQLGIERPIVVAHSWGTLVAISLALEQPQFVRSLVLLSGYYYPTPRLDVLFAAPMAIPLIGPLMRYTISPLVGRLIWPLAVRKLFTPTDQPARFKHRFPMWMALRPAQLQANAGDGVIMIPEAIRLCDRYRELKMPVTIMAGAGDLLALPKLHSKRLHEDIAHSKLIIVPGVGHMVHQVAPEEVMEAIKTISMQSDAKQDDAKSAAFVAGYVTA